jgi:hypothetical protein
MGIVRVKVVGNVRNGERVYASTSYPGKAVAESHSLHVDDDILLGIAMESCDGKDHQAETPVRCFVSFLCGINADYFSQKAQELELRTDANIEKVVHQKWKGEKQIYEKTGTFLSPCCSPTLYYLILSLLTTGL